MEIHNNNISPVEKEKLSIQKKSTVKPVETKKAEANSLNALASYGMAQVNSFGFKGKFAEKGIDVPQTSRLKLLNQLGITDKDEVERLSKVTGFQFLLASLYLYIGLGIPDAEKELSCDIEEVSEKENEELAEILTQSKDFLLNESQKVIEFINCLNAKKDILNDSNSVIEILIHLNENTYPYAGALIDDENEKYSLSQMSSLISSYIPETAEFVNTFMNDSKSQLSVDDKIEIISCLTPENIEIAAQLTDKNNSRFQPRQIKSILFGTSKDTIDLVKRVLSDKSLNYNAQDISEIIKRFKKDNTEIAEELLFNPKQEYTVNNIVNILWSACEKNKSFALSLIRDDSEDKYSADDIELIVCKSTGENLDFVQDFIEHNKNYTNKEKVKILSMIGSKNSKSVVQRLVNQNGDKKADADVIESILNKISFNPLKIEFAHFLTDLYENNEIELQDYIELIDDVEEETVDFIKELINVPKEKRCSCQIIRNIISAIKDNFNNQSQDGSLGRVKINKYKYDFAKYLADLAEKNEINLQDYIGLIPDVNEETIDFIKRLMNFPKKKRCSCQEIRNIIFAINENPYYKYYKDPATIQKISGFKYDFAQYLTSMAENDEIDLNKYIDLISDVNEKNINLIQKLLKAPKEIRFVPDKNKQYLTQISKILDTYTPDNADFIDELISQYSLDAIVNIAENLSPSNLEFAKELINKNSRYTPGQIGLILKGTNDNTIDFIRKLLSDENVVYSIEDLSSIIGTFNDNNTDIAEKLIYNPNQKYSVNNIICFLSMVNKYNKSLITELISDKSESKFKPIEIETIIFNAKEKTIDFIEDFVKNNKNFENKGKLAIIENTNEINVPLARQLVKIRNNKHISFNTISSLLMKVNYDSSDEQIEFAKFLTSLCENSETDINEYISWIDYINKNNINVLCKLIQNSDKLPLTDDEKITVLNNCNAYGYNQEKYKELSELIDLLKEGQITKKYFLAIINIENDISLNDIKQIEQIMGKEKVYSLCDTDLVIAAKFYDLCNKKNINEIPLGRKKSVLRKIVAANIGLFNLSDEIKQYFPLLPKNQEEYCMLLPALVRSLGIETNPLSEKEVNDFYTSLSALGQTLKGLTDKEFLSLQITQEYPKSEFIKDTLEIIKDISPQERQKVYDYFGFELKYNYMGEKKGEYSIIGYPENLNNGKKLSQITDERTKEVIEKLKEKVIKFSQNNKIHSNNPKIAELLNNIIKAFPELGTQIDKVQHGAHYYDIMKHSLKVLQKVVQNPEYDKLSDSDKRIMLICSLFHDGTKAEGLDDKLHDEEGAFDTYYIINKLNLPREENIKIYTLIKRHEWLKYINNNLYKDFVQKRQQSVAFDLQYDNLFELAKIFTIADLKAIKPDDEFYDRYKNDFETHSKAIEKCINELKKTQPLLPVTKVPTASRIEKAITTVNDDRSTNIKGIYKNKDGLIIIKYNEVENSTWEKIGFPKGSVSSGIETKGLVTINGETELLDEVNTGNIKFFVHGLDTADQLIKFDAFALPDSQVLLSVSYTERPESKYRFFRTQGVLLDVDTKYIHGGGNTDSGSGFGKYIDDFKSRYIFGGEREKDRNYVSDLIKEALNLTDEEYVEFVRQNADKPFTQIKPKETAEKIVKVFAAINSNTRIGNRNYNEMYISNPRVMGVFAYSQEDKVGDIMQFIDKQPKFLKQYALEKDLPFVVFGD